MLPLLIILFVIKLYARNNIFKCIKKKHGQDIIMIVRYYDEPLKAKLVKVLADIKFSKPCRKENLIPILAFKSSSRELELPLVRMITESDMENKHHEKSKPKKEIVPISNQLKGVLGLLVYNVYIKLSWQLKVVPNQHHFATRRNC